MGKGFFTATKVNELKADLKVMGALHRASGLSISLWPQLWVDHMVEVAGLYGDLSLTGGFKAEGRHNPLKQEVRNRSFKGVGKGSRLRGVRKSWGELIRNDNMDYNLLRHWSSRALLAASRRFSSAVCECCMASISRLCASRICSSTPGATSAACPTRIGGGLGFFFTVAGAPGLWRFARAPSDCPLSDCSASDCSPVDFSSMSTSMV